MVELQHENFFYACALLVNRVVQRVGNVEHHFTLQNCISYDTKLYPLQGKNASIIPNNPHICLLCERLKNVNDVSNAGSIQAIKMHINRHHCNCRILLSKKL